MSNNPWDTIDYTEAINLYDRRYETHQELLNLFNSGNAHDYVHLALGITDQYGNFSANRHGLGQKILNEPNAQKRVFGLAQQFYSCQDPFQIPSIIRDTPIPYLKISVGSEMAMMLRPDMFWLDNIRTMWGHLVITHSLKFAEDNLKDFTLGYNEDAPLRYSLWEEEYPEVGSSMKKVVELVNNFALNGGIQQYLIPINTNLWPDAVVNTAFNLSKWSSKY